MRASPIFIAAIVSAGEPAVRSVQHATKTIPILAVADDMLRSGFVTSLAKPEGNTTGVSILSTELDGKRQEILLEAMPGIRRIAALTAAKTAGATGGGARPRH